MALRSLFVASVLVVAAVAVPAGQAGATSHEGAVATAVPVGNDAPTGLVDERSSNESVETGVDNSTIFRKVEADRSSFVVDLNMSMFTSMFAKGSTFRLVTGGTVDGDRVVWFDVGIGYSGGSVLANPLDEFVVRSEMWINFPGL